MRKFRVRSSYEKSTRGCRTCKIRRVKCDETQPCCLKCTSSGRRCEGPASTSRSLNFVPDPINELIDQAQPPRSTLYAALHQARPSEELRAFSYFIDQAAPVLTGQVDIGFWGTTIPQIAQTNQVIWYALIAISGLWENPPLGSRGVRRDATRQQQALCWYAQAIANERSQSQNSYAAEKLLICILCSCFEFQNLNYQSGLLTIRIAYNLLGRSMTAVKKPENEFLFEALMTKLLRNACFSCTSKVSIDIHPEDQLNPDELEYSLFQLLLSTYGLLKEIHFLLLGRGDVTHQTQYHSHKHIEHQLQKWLTAANQQYQHTTTDAQRVQSLRAYHIITTTWLTLMHQAHQSQPLIPTFQANIIHQSESILHLTTTNSPSTPVYFRDFILLPPLYFVVMLSTDPTIHDRALTLMRTATHQKRGEQNHSLVAMQRPEMGTVGIHMARVRWVGNAGDRKEAEVEACAFAVAEL